MMVVRYILLLGLLFNFIWAEKPTFESLTRLYVSTFNRAPDRAGIDYWLYDSFGGNATLEEIASSFFDQPETKELYPDGTSNREFVKQIYQNLLDRDPDEEGWDYWIRELDSGNIKRSEFILAVINGALAAPGGTEDANILNNKTVVGKTFAEKGLNDADFAKIVMAGITSDYATVEEALAKIDRYINNSVVKLLPNDSLDEYINKSASSTIETTSGDIDISTTPIPGSKQISSTDIITQQKDSNTIEVDSLSVTVSDADKDKPLFVDGEFKGIIESIQNNGSSYTITLKDANKISEVYSNFDLLFSNDEVLQSINRAIHRGRLKGKYDYLNKHPLKFRVFKKRILNRARNITKEDIVLRIDIPKGYKIPIDSRSLNCSISNLECRLTVDAKASERLSIEEKLEKHGITFSTEGSYIEIGLGAYLRAHYDHNVVGDDIFDFDAAQSAYFEANVAVTITGELSKEWSSTIKLMNPFDVEIVHPYSEIAKTSILISPKLIIGADGKIKGEVKASSFVNRTGEIRYGYDSTTGNSYFKNNILYNPKNATKSDLSISLEADGNAYVMPALTLLPRLRFARIAPSITLAYIRSGIKLNTALLGKIDSGFSVVNNSDIKKQFGSEAKLITSVEGVVQGKWYLRVPPVTLYKSDDYFDIYTTDKLKIVDWSIQLLPKPIIKMEKTDDGNYRVLFDIDVNDNIKTAIKFYYTLDGSDISANEIGNIINRKLPNSNQIGTSSTSSAPAIWQIGDGYITVAPNSVIKVRAYLNNKDISNSIWSWGSSISAQATKETIDIQPPAISPDSGIYEGPITVSITPDNSDDVVYYRVDDGTLHKYTEPFPIEYSAKVSAYSRRIKSDESYYSKTVEKSYTICEENQKVENGMCVDDDTYTDSSDEQNDLNHTNNYDEYLQKLYDNGCILDSEGNITIRSAQIYDNGDISLMISYVPNSGLFRIDATFDYEGTMCSCTRFSHGNSAAINVEPHQFECKRVDNW